MTGLTALDPQLLAGPHGQLARVWLTLPDRSRELYVATPTACSVTFDALRSPRVTARLTLPTPPTAAEADYTDHRLGARVLITAGYRQLNGAELTDTLADLAVTDRQLDRPGDTFTLDAAGAEQLVTDRPLAVALTYPAGTLVSSLVRDVLDRTLGAGTYTLDTDPRVTGTLPGALDVPAGGDLFDLLETATDSVGAELYADELGTFHLRPEPVIGTPATVLTGGAGGTLTDLSSDLTRSLWASRVLLIHEWTDGAAARRVVGTARTLPDDTGRAARARVFRRSTGVTQATADAAAAQLLARCRSAGGGQTFTAVADYRLRPGMTVTLRDRLLGDRDVLVTSLTFDLAAGTMTGSTRDTSPED